MDSAFLSFLTLTDPCDPLAGLACLHLAALNRQHQVISDLAKKGANLNVQVSLGNVTPSSVLFCVLALL